MFKLEPIIISIGSYKFKLDTDFRKVIQMIYSDDINVLDLLPNEYWIALDYLSSEQTRPLLIEMHMLQVNRELFPKDEFPPIQDVEDNEDEPSKTVHYLKDYPMIISAFQHYYNIDLLNIEFMDFRQFLILMHNIKGTTLNDIIRIREMKLPTGKDQHKEREELMVLKARYSIDDEQSEKDFTNWAEIADQIEQTNKQGE